MTQQPPESDRRRDDRPSSKTESPATLSKRKRPEDSGEPLYLFQDKQLWLTVSVLLTVPIVLAAAVFELLSFSSVLFDWLLNGLAAIVLLVLIGVTFAIVPGLLLWGAIETFRFMHRRGFSDLVALALPLSTIAFGIGLGSLLRPGSFYPLWSIVTGVTAVPLGTMLVYQPIRRSRQLAQYRKSQKHLIQP